jgi:hypothetical protein
MRTARPRELEADKALGVDYADLARYLTTVVHGPAAQAAGGATRKESHAAWDGFAHQDRESPKKPPSCWWRSPVDRTWLSFPDRCHLRACHKNPRGRRATHVRRSHLLLIGASLAAGLFRYLRDDGPSFRPAALAS